MVPSSLYYVSDYCSLHRFPFSTPPPQKKKKERKRKFLLRNLIRNKVQKLWNDCFTDMLHETKILEFPGAPKD